MSKLLNLSEAQQQLAKEKANGKCIVFTNGCFDILHAGHTTYLADAKACGDILVLGLNSDVSIKAIKGEKRPIVAETYRAQTLAALESIDYIILFDEETPIHLIETLKPDIYVKGGDYTEETLPETPIVKSYGGTVKLLPFVEGLSTSTIINKILEVYGQ